MRFFYGLLHEISKNLQSIWYIRFFSSSFTSSSSCFSPLLFPNIKAKGWNTRYGWDALASRRKERPTAGRKDYTEAAILFTFSAENLAPIANRKKELCWANDALRSDYLTSKIEMFHRTNWLDRTWKMLLEAPALHTPGLVALDK